MQGGDGSVALLVGIHRPGPQKRRGFAQPPEAPPHAPLPGGAKAGAGRHGGKTRAARSFGPYRDGMPENMGAFPPAEDVPIPGLDDPDPDPGNSDPEAFTADLDPDELDDVYAHVNEVAVTLPEPGEF